MKTLNSGTTYTQKKVEKIKIRKIYRRKNGQWLHIVAIKFNKKINITNCKNCSNERWKHILWNYKKFFLLLEKKRKDSTRCDSTELKSRQSSPEAEAEGSQYPGQSGLHCSNTLSEKIKSIFKFKRESETTNSI
jgi:hypothetical protein